MEFRNLSSLQIHLTALFNGTAQVLVLAFFRISPRVMTTSRVK
jgi:hypothetical protein